MGYFNDNLFYKSNDKSLATKTIGNGAFVNGVLDLGLGKKANVVLTDYENFLILQICDPSRGAKIDGFQLLVRTNSTYFLDPAKIATVFREVVFVQRQNPLTIPFVGRCACDSLPPV